MDNNVNTDDDRQTSSSDQSSSNDLSSMSSETLLPVHEKDQPQMSNMSNVRIRTIKVDNHTNLPNLMIKHPNRSDDNNGNDPFNDEKRIIIDKHIKISHINRSNLRHSTTDIPPLKLEACSSGKSIDSITVSRGNQNLSKSINGNLNNQETTKITSRESTVRIIRTSTAANKNQGSNKKVIASKPLVTRIPFDKLPLRKKKKELHVSVQHVTLNSKKSS